LKKAEPKKSRKTRRSKDFSENIFNKKES